MLFEIRFSPQLHYWFYGYYSGGFTTEMRAGGFRTVVFIGNGLVVALYVVTTAVVAAALWRVRVRIQRLPPGGVTAYLSALLILCKTAGALIYGAVSSRYL